mmetsp:Transcript_13916/g.40140  ORF Transcript_13916/g.40140 Transcript_13916/m.40140 type:complete len:237 (+) Transcript_13916:1094-1804(+)
MRKCSDTFWASVDFPDAGGPPMSTRIARSLRSLQNSPAILRMFLSKPSRQHHSMSSGSNMRCDGAMTRSRVSASWRLRSSAPASSSPAGATSCTSGTSYGSQISSTMPCTSSACVGGKDTLPSGSVTGWSTARKYGVSLGSTAASLPTSFAKRARSRTWTVGIRFFPLPMTTCSCLPHQASLNNGVSASSPSPYKTPPATTRAFTLDSSRLKQLKTKFSMSFHCSYRDPGFGVRCK